MKIIKKYVSEDISILFLRIVIGSIFIVHGVSKFSMWYAPPEEFSKNMVALMKLLSIVEPIAGILIILGLLTSVSALTIVLIMIGAIIFKMFIIKSGFAAQKGTGWEFDLVLFASSLYILLHGGGKYSIDNYRKKSSALDSNPQEQ